MEPFGPRFEALNTGLICATLVNRSGGLDGKAAAPGRLSQGDREELEPLEPRDPRTEAERLRAALDLHNSGVAMRVREGV